MYHLAVQRTCTINLVSADGQCIKEDQITNIKEYTILKELKTIKC